MQAQGSRRLRVGQVGVGGFGATRRALLKTSGLFELAAVCDHDAAVLAQAAREEDARPCARYEDLLREPGLEAVVISTGARDHAAQVRAALDRGLHVFVEKPLCATEEEMAALLARQRETGLVVGVGHVDHAHDARSRTIKALLEQGALGRVAAVEKTTAHSGGFEIRPGDWRSDPEKNPGGMLFQCGVHAVHELLFYFGPVASVFCAMRSDVHTTPTADTAHALLVFASGLIATLNAYHVTPYRHALDIFGTERLLHHEHRAYGEPDIFVQQQRRRGELEPVEPVAVEGTSDPCGNLRSFVSAVRSGGEPYPSIRDGARALAVVFAAARSARSGRMEPVAAVA